MSVNKYNIYVVNTYILYTNKIDSRDGKCTTLGTKRLRVKSSK